MNKSISLVMLVFLITVSSFPLNYVLADPLPAGSELFYTRFSGTSRVEKVTVSFDGTTFSLGIPVTISSGHGADGITGNPNDPGSLLVGGQANQIHRVSRIPAPLIQTLGTPTPSFHISVVDSSNMYSSSIPGPLTHVVLNPGGSIGPASVVPITSGPDTVVTTIIPTPAGFFYTTGGSGGFGNYGTITFSGVPPLQTASTTRLHGLGGSISTSTIPAAHGGVYDPSTGTVILFGDAQWAQLDLSGNIITTRSFSGITCPSSPSPFTPQFDQGTVDGNGHAFVASNTGHLFFMDYSASGSISSLSNFIDCPFLAGSLDDVAPLIGAGSTGNTLIGGEIIPVDTTSLLIAGTQSNSYSILSALAFVGAVAFGTLYFKSKRRI